jgi:hypothetical protein
MAPGACTDPYQPPKSHGKIAKDFGCGYATAVATMPTRRQGFESVSNPWRQGARAEIRKCVQHALPGRGGPGAGRLGLWPVSAGTCAREKEKSGASWGARCRASTDAGVCASGRVGFKSLESAQSCGAAFRAWAR